MAATARAYEAPAPQIEAEQSDSQYIANEPALPPPWTEARAAHDQRQAAMVAGLLASSGTGHRSQTVVTVANCKGQMYEKA